MLKRLVISLFIFFVFSSAYSATCNSSLSGLWGNLAIWSCLQVPEGGDIINIKPGHTVTVSSIFTIAGAPVTLRIDGNLDFQTGKKMTLPAGSVIEISSTGTISKGSGGGSSNVITIGTVDVWRAADGNISGPLRLDESCVASAGCILPLILLEFNVEVENGFATLHWKTAGESNIDYFSVEYSDDMESWTELVRMDDNGQMFNSYSYTDPKPLSEVLYYRIKEVDLNGMVFYYYPKPAKPEAGFNLSVYPNPSTGFFTIFSPEKGDFSLISITGSKVMTGIFGAGSTICPTAHLPRGYYILVLDFGQTARRIPVELT